MGRYNGAIQIAQALPNNIAAVDFTDWDEVSGTFLNSGLATDAGNAVPINNPERTAEGVILNGLDQNLKLRLSTASVKAKSVLLIYRPITVSDYYIFDVGVGETGNQDFYARCRNDGDLLLAAGSSSTDVNEPGLVQAGEIQYTIVNANATFSFAYHGTVPLIDYIAMGNSSEPESTNVWGYIGANRNSIGRANIEALFFGVWDDVITSNELSQLLDTFNHYGRLTLPTNLESARHQSIISLGPNREVSTLSNVFNGETDLDIRLPYESGQPVEFFAFDTDESKTNLTTGPVVPSELEPLVFNPVAGGDGGNPGTGLIAHIAGTVSIDSEGYARDVVVISDDPAGRKVLGEGVSANDGSFDIQYEDWGGAVIALAIDKYGADWEAENAIAVGTFVHPSTPNGYVYEATNGGTTGTTEPTWSINGSVNDGSVIWNPKPFYRPIASGPIQGEVLQQADPLDLTYAKILSASSESVIAIDANQELAFWGDIISNTGSAPPAMSDLIDLDLGSNNAIALHSDGTITTWGKNIEGEETYTAPTDVIQVAAGDSYYMILKSDGTVEAWGRNDYGQSTVPAGLTGVKQIQAARFTAFALKEDGTVAAWGRNFKGERDVFGLSGIDRIGIKVFSGVAIKTDGTAVTWGRSESNEQAIPAGITGVIDGQGAPAFGVVLKDNGDLISWGDDGVASTAGLSANIPDAWKVYCGFDNTYVVTTNGTLYGGGDTTSGLDAVPEGLTLVTER